MNTWGKNSLSKHESPQNIHDNIFNKSNIIQSLHKSSKKKADQFQNLLKKRVNVTNIEKQSK